MELTVYLQAAFCILLSSVLLAGVFIAVIKYYLEK